MASIFSFRPRIALSASVLALTLSGCVTPAPAPPSLEKASYAGTFNASLSGDQTFATAWWEQFGDDTLTALISQALQNNVSLDITQANVEIAQAISARTRLGQSYSTVSTTSANLGRPAREGQDIELSATSAVGASWEYDAFGRITAQIEAAELGVIAAEETRRDLSVIIASETATAYVDLRGSQRRLEVARQNADAQLEGLELLNTLLENGRATRLDLERAEAQYRTTLALLPRFEAGAETALIRLATLLGQPANSPTDPLISLKSSSEDIPEHSGVIITGGIESLIRRRPDIRQAETLIGQRLALGEAERARLFPTVTFNADIFALFSEANDIGDAISIGFGIGPAIRWDGPDLRGVRADIDIADAQTRVAIATYEQTVLNALSEVEIAITEYAREGERRADLIQAAQSARRALELARLRFEEGLDDYLDVIDAQRTLLDAEDRLADSRIQTTNRAIAAYRALGGVWETTSTTAQSETEAS